MIGYAYFHVDTGEGFSPSTSGWCRAFSVVPGLAGILFGGFFLMMSRKLADRVAPKVQGYLRVGLILLGTYLATYCLVEIVGGLALRWEKDFDGPSAAFRATFRLRLLEGVARCVLGALLLLGPGRLRPGAPVMESDRD